MKLAEAITKGSAPTALEAAYEGLTGQSSEGKTLSELIAAIRAELEYEIDSAYTYDVEWNMLNTPLLSCVLQAERDGDTKAQIAEYVAGWERFWWPDE